MKREEFEHVIRAAAAVVNDELVIVGSQAVLGQHPDAPDSLLRSAEVDLYPKHKPENADLIDGVLGDGSRFHETYAYYAHGVGPETTIAPAGWQDRMVRLEFPPFRRTDGRVVAWCLETHDLVLAKLAAGRPRDFEFAQDAIRAGIVDVDQLEVGVELMPESHRDRTRDALAIVCTRL